MTPSTSSASSALEAASRVVPASASASTSSAPVPEPIAVQVHDLQVDLGGRPVLRGLDLQGVPGEVLGVLGPNGCGKSTLLRCIGGVLRPARGRVTLGEDDVARLPPHRLAQVVALQSQEAPAALGHSVRDIVDMGRLAHRRLFRGASRRDAEIVDDCLARLDVSHLADRLFDALSGGERQRVLIARALAQQPRVLLLDEPTNHLDVLHQFEVLALVRALGITVVVTLHDLQLAARACDRVALLHHGRVAALAPPAEALTPERIKSIYGVGSRIDLPDDADPFGLRVHLYPLQGKR